MTKEQFIDFINTNKIEWLRDGNGVSIKLKPSDLSKYNTLVKSYLDDASDGLSSFLIEGLFVTNVEEALCYYKIKANEVFNNKPITNGDN